MKLQMPEEEITYLLVDGENIDATLGLSVLQRCSDSDERPRWDQVRGYIAKSNVGETKALPFFNATTHMPMTFVQAFLAMNYLLTPLSSEEVKQVVDVGIQYTLNTTTARGEGNIILISHDGDFEPQLQTLLRNGHRVAVVRFDEFLGGELRSPEEQGLKIIDLGYEIHTFSASLPRIQVINLDDYNPAASIWGAI